MKHIRKKKKGTRLYLVSFLLLTVMMMGFVVSYQSPESSSTFNADIQGTSPTYHSIIEPVSDIEAGSESGMSPDNFECFDPMTLVDTSVDVYRALTAIRVKDAPKERTYYFSLNKNERLMIRQELQDGWYLVQLANGKLGYINDFDNLEYVGRLDGAVTRDKDIPRDASSYVVGYGDRILRYRSSPELKNNAVAIVDIGTRVYALSNNGLYFRVVLEDGRTGYINSQCLQPTVAEGYRDDLPIVDGGRTAYGYQEMMDDIVLLLAEYPQYVKLFDSGRSELGRTIPVLLVGNEDAPRKLLVQAAIHGREYATTQILMKQLEILLYHCDNPNDRGDTYGHILEDTAYYIIPMSNPDGCMISILGELSIPEDDTREQLLSIRDANVEPKDTDYNHYFRLWKANANGVDLNRNFDANWDRVQDSLNAPANVDYKGSAPFSQSESAFLKEYVEREDVAVTISYHTSGAMVFWWYYQEDDMLAINYDLAYLVHRNSGYPIMGRRESYGSHGGMKDYGIVLGKPSITIEMGYYSTPIPPTDIIEVMSKTRRLLPQLGKWLIRKMGE